jgi:DNA-binding HxlR family transcriptional regulator/putative sterol carrier protein
MSRNYGQFCGLSRALDLLGGRWALLVVRDLLSGPKRFTELQEGLPGIPTNVLTTRLRELEEAGVAQRRAQAGPGGGVVYELTPYGLQLEEPLLRLGYWGARLMGEPAESDFISTDALALALRGAFRPAKARGPQRLYELKVSGKPLRIAVKGGHATVPATAPDDPDLVLEAPAGVFAELFSGRTDVDAAMSSHRLHVHGDRADARRLFEMFRFPTTHEAPAPV